MRRKKLKKKLELCTIENRQLNDMIRKLIEIVEKEGIVWHDIAPGGGEIWRMTVDADDWKKAAAEYKGMK